MGDVHEGITMATHFSPTDITRRIQQLQEERQQHEEAISLIDQTLAGVGAVLGNGSIARGAQSKPASAPAETAPRRGRKRRRGKFEVTGEQSVLSFVKSERNPTSREIEEHWKSEGRGGPAAIMLSKLVKEDKLKRTPLEGQRGSRYSLV